MTVSVITDITQAVTDELNGGAFSLPLTAARAYRPAFDLQEMKDLHVTVVPKGIACSRLDRGRGQLDVQVDIAVQKKVSAETAEVLDPLMGVVQEIADFLIGRPLGNAPGVIWIKTDNEPVYAQEHLSEMRQFTSLLTVTYRVAR